MATAKRIFSIEPFHGRFWWLHSAMEKQWEICHLQYSGKFSTVRINNGKFFPLHMSSGRFLWGKIWWESNGKFPTTHINSGKPHFTPTFTTVIFNRKTYFPTEFFLSPTEFTVGNWWIFGSACAWSLAYLYFLTRIFRK